MLYEAWRRLSEPADVASGLTLAVALVGLGANALSLHLLHEGQASSLNMRGAYLEVMGDFAGSAAVIVAALVIAATGWTQADAVASALIGILILPRTYGLLRDAVDVLLEATPKGLDMGLVRSHILEAPGVSDVHDLHAWTITSGLNVVSAHVVLDPGVTLRRSSTICVHLPVRLLRHRALDLPARNGRPPSARGDRARMNAFRAALIAALALTLAACGTGSRQPRAGPAFFVLLRTR